MPRDIEQELRRSLQARATDVSPDPATFARVQSRIRRGRTFRLALAGLATTLAVAGIAVAAPRLIDRRIEFEPGPVATAPASEPTVDSADPAPVPGNHRLVFTDGEGVYAMALDGEAAETLIPSPCPEGSECDMEPLRSVAAVAGGPDVADITAVAASCGNLQYVQGAGAVADIDTGADVCTTSAEFSPDGRHLAWIGQASPEAEPMLHTVDWTATGAGDDDAGFGLPWADATEVSIQDWIWTEAADGTAQGEIVLRARRDDLIQLLRMPVERQEDGALATTLEAPPVSARPGFVPLAFAASGTAVEHTLEARQEPDGYADMTIVRRVGGEIDAEIGAPTDLLESTRDFNESDLWMSDSGGAVLFGNAVTGNAWYLPYPYEGEGPPPSPSALPPTIRHGELISMPPAGLPDATEAPSTAVEVDVYFGMEGADACTAPQTVTREVEGPGVARAALTELLKGPTSRENKEGITSPFNANTAGALNDITITDGVAEVDLADFRDVVSTDSCTKSAIVDALDKTLKQFPTVTSTRYSFDGDAQAWESWLGQSSESTDLPQAVAETAEQIHAAASSRDWDALRRLSSETACTFSDQKEPCVPHWQELEEQGSDPLGVLVDILEQEPGLNPNAPIWVWPVEYFDQDYLGPRAGIREDGVWMFYQLGGD